MRADIKQGEESTSSSESEEPDVHGARVNCSEHETALTRITTVGVSGGITFVSCFGVRAVENEVSELFLARRTFGKIQSDGIYSSNETEMGLTGNFFVQQGFSLKGASS